MASYDKSVDSNYTRQVQQILASMGADLGPAGIDGKWGSYTQAAYTANKAAVDAALYGQYGQSGQNQYLYQNTMDFLPAPSVQTVSVPSYSYEYYYSIGDALEAANYERQRLKAQNNLTANQEALARDVQNIKGNIEKSTTARGFGRSSYTTDALQATDLAALRQGQALFTSFDQTLMLLDAERHSNAANYAAKAFQAQEDRRLQADLYNARAANEMALSQWNAQFDLMADLMKDQASAGYSASSGSSRSSGSSSRRSSSSGSSSSKGSSNLKNALVGTDTTGISPAMNRTKGGVTTRKNTIQVR